MDFKTFKSQVVQPQYWLALPLHQHVAVKDQAYIERHWNISPGAVNMAMYAHRGYTQGKNVKPLSSQEFLAYTATFWNLTNLRHTELPNKRLLLEESCFMPPKEYLKVLKMETPKINLTATEVKLLSDWVKVVGNVNSPV